MRLFNRFRLWLGLILIGKEVFDMAIIYADLIIEGYKEYKDVPARIKAQVKEVLEQLGCGYLAVEE